MHPEHKIHLELTTLEADQNAKLMRHNRFRNSWRRAREVEHKCHKLNEYRLNTYDARLDFLNGQRANYKDRIDKAQALVEKRMSKNGKAICQAPPAIEANGYGVMKCIQPGGLLGDNDHLFSQGMRKRIPGMGGPRGICPALEIPH